MSIRIFFAGGTPEALRIVDRSNWAGVAVVCSRKDYLEARARDEFTRPGVYVLIGPSDTGDLPKVYVGEADQPRSRLNNHLANTDFWTRLVLFTSKDGSLNKAHTRHIEARLIGLANEAKRSEVQNGNAPQLPALAEADVADAESFLADMLLIYPVLEVSAFELAPPPSIPTDRLYLEGPEAKGSGSETSEGFLVYKESMARKSTVPSIHSYLVTLRQKLLDQGVLQQENAGLRLTQDYVFNSPSTAAGVLLGRSANGRTEWKDGKGRTLKEIGQAAVADETAA